MGSVFRVFYVLIDGEQEREESYSCYGKAYKYLTPIFLGFFHREVL